MDERLRLLALAAARGDPQAEAHLLLTRVRNGDLDPARLERAADLGHEAASLAVGRVPAWTSADPGAWPAHLQTTSRLVQARVALVLARLILWSASPSWDGRQGVERVHMACAAWTECPCEEHLQAAHRAGDDVPRADLLRGRRSARAGDAALRLLAILAGFHDPPPPGVVMDVHPILISDRDMDVRFRPPFPRLIAMAQDAGADAALLRAALRDDVETWLLNTAAP